MDKILDLQIETTKIGNPTLQISYDDKTLYLHSKYNPIREAEKWAKEFYQKGKLSIIIGLGLGYYAQALLNLMDENDHILIIEPYEEIFELAKENGLGQLVTDPRVFICLQSDKNKLGQVLRGLITEHLLKNSEILVAPNYDKIAEVEAIIFQLKRAFIDYAVDINTKLAAAFNWQENYFRNIEHAIQSCPLTAFENKFTCPVIIVSAGPSLQNELEKLKAAYQHAIIISAGSATPVLLKNGVKPHLVMCIDGGIEMYNHFKDIDYEELPLFYIPSQHYKITERHRGLKVLFQIREIKIVDWYNELIGFNTGTVAVGPSVANFALDIACRMTSGPICFVGQDLGYVGGFSHAEGNDNRVSSETKQGLISTPSNDGGVLYADYAFVLMREWFEKYLSANPRGNVYNASLHGAEIKGTKVIAFHEFMNEFCQEKIDAEQNIKEISNSWHVVHKNKIDLEKIIQELGKTLEMVITATKEADELSRRLLDSVENCDYDSIDELLVKLSQVDDEIMSLKNKDGLLYLIIQMIVDILILWDEDDEDDHKKRIKIAKKNKFFYNNLYRMARTVRKMLDDMEKKDDRDGNESVEE